MCGSLSFKNVFFSYVTTEMKSDMMIYILAKKQMYFCASNKHAFLTVAFCFDTFKKYVLVEKHFVWSA